MTSASACPEPCPSEATFARFVDHTLAAEDRQRLDEHVAGCAACWQWMMCLLEDQEPVLAGPDADARIAPSVANGQALRLPPPRVPPATDPLRMQNAHDANEPQVEVSSWRPRGYPWIGLLGVASGIVVGMWGWREAHVAPTHRREMTQEPHVAAPAVPAESTARTSINTTPTAPARNLPDVPSSGVASAGVSASGANPFAGLRVDRRLSAPNPSTITSVRPEAVQPPSSGPSAGSADPLERRD